MNCPHCDKPVQIPDVAYMNVDTYRQPKLTVTRCCGRGVYLIPLTQYAVERDLGKSTHDAWGRRLIVS